MTIESDEKTGDNWPPKQMVPTAIWGFAPLKLGHAHGFEVFHSVALGNVNSFGHPNPNLNYTFRSNMDHWLVDPGLGSQSLHTFLSSLDGLVIHDVIPRQNVSGQAPQELKDKARALIEVALSTLETPTVLPNNNWTASNADEIDGAQDVFFAKMNNGVLVPDGPCFALRTHNQALTHLRVYRKTAPASGVSYDDEDTALLLTRVGNPRQGNDRGVLGWHFKQVP